MNEEHKIDKLYKISQNRQYTSHQKEWYEENLSKPDPVHITDVWLDEIPFDPPNITTNDIEIISDLRLTEDKTSEGKKTWIACKNPGLINTRISDFIQPSSKTSTKYNVKVFDDDGKQVIFGDAAEWDFDYKNGVLTFFTDIQQYKTPFHLYGYRYAGRKGAKSSFGVKTLDDAYDGENGNGSGRIITADRGPVEITSDGQGSAPFRLAPEQATPTFNLQDGQMCVRDGIMYIYDSSREAWLSMQRQAISFGSKRADGVFMNLSNFSSSMSGWPALRKGYILGITAQASGGFPQKEIKILNNSQDVYTFNLFEHSYANGNLKIGFEGGDLIKILISSEFATTYNLVLNLEIAWTI